MLFNGLSFWRCFFQGEIHCSVLFNLNQLLGIVYMLHVTVKIEFAITIMSSVQSLVCIYICCFGVGVDGCIPLTMLIDVCQCCCLLTAFETLSLL